MTIRTVWILERMRVLPDMEIRTIRWKGRQGTELLAHLTNGDSSLCKLPCDATILVVGPSGGLKRLCDAKLGGETLLCIKNRKDIVQVGMDEAGGCHGFQGIGRARLRGEREGRWSRSRGCHGER